MGGARALEAAVNPAEVLFKVRKEVERMDARAARIEEAGKPASWIRETADALRWVLEWVETERRRELQAARWRRAGEMLGRDLARELAGFEVDRCATCGAPGLRPVSDTAPYGWFLLGREEPCCPDCWRERRLEKMPARWPVLARDLTGERCLAHLRAEPCPECAAFVAAGL